MLRAFGVCSFHKDLFVQLIADVLGLDMSLSQAGLTLDGVIHLRSHNEHLLTALLPDLVALWWLGQTRGFGTC